MKLIIAGGRDFNNANITKLGVKMMSKLMTERNKLSTPWLPSCIVSGGAKGADYQGQVWSANNNVPVQIYPADWKAHGAGAGMIRNKEMSKHADALLAFWDGKSTGTFHMINTMVANNSPVMVISYVWHAAKYSKERGYEAPFCTLGKEHTAKNIKEGAKNFLFRINNGELVAPHEQEDSAV
jgi:hypothetical protein